jgi:hypothetical protein
LQAAAISLDLDFISDYQIIENIRLKVYENMVDSTMFSGNPPKLSLGFSRNNLGDIAHAGKQVESPVWSGLSLEFCKVGDTDSRLDMICEQSTGRVSDPDIIGDAADSWINVGVPFRINAIRVDAAKRGGDFTDYRLGN